MPTHPLSALLICLLCLTRYSPVEAIELVAAGPNAADSQIDWNDLGPLRNWVPPSHIFGQNPTDFYLTNVGAVTSEGDFARTTVPGGTNAQLARTQFGLDGSGIKIGIISDSFGAHNGTFTTTADDIFSGDLPGAANPNNYLAPVNILNDDFGTDEGRAMAQIVHDIAPGAELFFHSAFNNSGDQSTIAMAIDNLVAAGVDIIVDDVAFINEPYFQDGVVAQSVDNAFANGIAYFSSAGNNADESYEGLFANDGFNSHNFDLNGNEGVDNFLNIAVAPNSLARIVVEWDDPYPSVGGFPTADFDVGLFDFSTSSFVSASFNDQTTGADPWEIVGVVNPDPVFKEYGLFVQHFAGDPNKKLKAIVHDTGSIFDDDDTDSPTIVGHKAAKGGQAVAAAGWDIGTSVELFSSSGPTEIIFDTAGNRLATPEVRQTPQLSATDAVNTTFFGFDFDLDGFPNFFGTSAAAPHAAAVAGLVLEYAHTLNLPLVPTQLYDILQSTAFDIETLGFDFLSGHGLLDALAAVEAVEALSQPIPEPNTLALMATGLVGLFGMAYRRRKH